MIIRNLLNNETVGAGGTLWIVGIGAGIYRPMRLEQVGSVTRISLTFSRNGTTKATATVTPYEGTVLDMSMMAAATPSITESINAGLGFTDFVDSVTVLYTEGNTVNVMNLAVIHAPLADGRFATSVDTRNLSDYGNGIFNQVDFSCASFLNSPLTGTPFNFALRYGQLTANSDGRLRYRNNGTGTSLIWANTTYSNAPLPMREFRTADDASVWGYARFERKYPYCPDPNKRVTLRWLNSKGAYDTMYFDKYRIVPTYLVNFSGGNRVLSYDVTISVVVTDDNQNALYWLSRSGEVAGVFPLATNQWARVTIQNPNALNIQGGATGRVAAFKCKFEIIEP